MPFMWLIDLPVLGGNALEVDLMSDKIQKKEINRVAIIFCMAAMALLMTLIIFPFYRRMNHLFDQSKDIYTVSIHMSDDVPRGSYGREMRIVSASVNGTSVDLERFENEDWVWHGEWGYVLYQNGKNDFFIESDEPVKNFSMEYVKQEGSGICSIELGDDVIDLNMYRRSWKNTFFKVSYQNPLQKVLSFADIYLLSLLIAFLGYRIIIYLKNKDQVVGGIGSSLTMFDLAKGLGMIFIVLGHSIEDYVWFDKIFASVNSAFFGLIGVVALYSLMTMFFIASGYGFRKGDIRNTIRMQLKYLLAPYWKVVLGVTAVCLLRVLVDESFGINDLLFKVLPFPLFSAHDGLVAGISIGNIGPIWYGVSLCFAWIILSLIFLADSRFIQIICVAVCVVISYILSKFDVYYFCLTQIFAAVPMIYAGYLIRNNKIWTKETGSKRIVYILLALVFCFGAMLNGMPFGMAVNNWGSNQILGLFVSTLGGFLLLRIILTLNKPLKGKAGFIKKIGRDSYYVFYIHTLEYIAVPWKQIMSRITVDDWFKIVIIFVCRSILIWLILSAIKKIRSISRYEKQ